MNFSNSTYLIIGGFNFIGSKFISYLLSFPYDTVKNVIVIDNKISESELDTFYLFITDKRFKFYQLDLLNDIKTINNIFNKYQVDYCVYLNKILSNNLNDIILHNNIIVNILNICNNIKYDKEITLFYLSSAIIYKNNNTNYFSETSPLEVKDFTSATIINDESLIKANVLNDKVSYIIGRISNVYGVDQTESHFISKIINIILENKINQFSYKGHNKHDFIMVNDVSNAILKLLHSSKRNVTYNIGSGHGTSNYELINNSLKIFNNLQNDKIYYLTDDTIKFLNEQESDIEYVLDCEKIKNEIGWKPSFSLEYGLMKIIKNIYKNYTN